MFLTSTDMAIGKIRDEIDNLPKAMPAPKTYGALSILEESIALQFPFAREAALRSNREKIEQIESIIRQALAEATNTPNDTVISDELRDQAIKLLRHMHILSPDEKPSKLTTAILNVRKFVRTTLRSKASL